MLKHYPAVGAVQVFGESNSTSYLPQQSGENFAPFGSKLATHIYAIQFKQVESVEERFVRSLPGHGGPHPIEVGGPMHQIAHLISGVNTGYDRRT
jgi:hypothetical protein